MKHQTFIANCKKCRSFALQSMDQRGMYNVHCFNEFSSETFDCDAPEGPKFHSSQASIDAWNAMQGQGEVTSHE